MIPLPEFSRVVGIDTLQAAPRAMVVEADAQERAALAARFGLIAVDSLSAEVELSRDGGTIAARGTLSATLTQSCVATAEPVPAIVEEAFEIAFRPLPDADMGEEEVELGEDELDVIFYEGGTIDIGEAVAETLFLSLDPYSRAPQAEEALRAAGVIREEEARPAGALAGLKDLLGK